MGFNTHFINKSAIDKEDENTLKFNEHIESGLADVLSHDYKKCTSFTLS